MLHNSRKAAHAAGESKYHTGAPCRNGHDTFRYTSSGTCEGCIKKAKAGYQTSASDDNRAKFYEESTPVYIFLPPKDLELMREALRQINAARWVGVDSAFIVRKPVSGGLAKYEVRAHMLDAQLVRDVAEAFCKPMMGNGKAAYALVHSRLAVAPPPIEPRR